MSYQHLSLEERHYIEISIVFSNSSGYSPLFNEALIN